MVSNQNKKGYFMKTSLWIMGFCICILMVYCNKNDEQNQTSYRFEAKIHGVGGDCNMCLIEFTGNTDDVQEIAGYPPVDSRYYAGNLDESLIVAGQLIRLNIRKPEAAELPVCTTMGIAFPMVMVTEAERK
jgi:hypothetical protein